ncbi:hypothetical protein OG772_20750 [Streptomyces sp. NBC_01321]|uniref:hypothetical protein n=1 Tax=Streptomyces sp. NBC_01321 TaxID=2903825 RepID=UPI002E13B310|nr:hypothetical protein OG772_20750 [Streptomyces sp. NBC_01321]
MKRLALSALVLTGLMVIGIFVDEGDPKNADPVVGGCMATGGKEPIVAECDSTEADVKILQILPGETTDGCLAVAGATDAYILKKTIRVGGDDGVDVGETGSSVLCVGAN